MMVNPSSWVEAWARHHGEDTLREFPTAGLEELNGASGFCRVWKAQINFATYKDLDTMPASSDVDGYGVPLAVSSAITNSPTSWADHVDDHASQEEKIFKPKLVLGSLGEIGIASESAQTGDLIVQITYSSLSNSRSIYLLARQTRDCFTIIGRVFLLHENNQVSTDPSVDREGKSPAKEMLLYLAIGALQRLAMRTTYWS